MRRELECSVEFAELALSGGAVAEPIGLPAKCYTSPEFYDFELSSIWGCDWFCVGRDSDVPCAGDYYTLQIGPEPVVVIRGDDDQVRVLSSVCRHRGMIVVEGRGSVRHLRCPFHSWSYSTSGKLVSAPDMSQVPGFERATFDLPEIKSVGWLGFRFATFNPEPSDLLDRLSEAEASLAHYELSELAASSPLELEIYPCNWKLFADECYHCSLLHSQTWHKLYPTPRSRVDLSTPYHDVEAGVIAYELVGTHLDASPTRTGSALHPILPRLTTEERSRLRYTTVMPNLLIVAMPDKVKYFMWLPAGPTQSYFGVSWLFPESTRQMSSFETTFEMERHDLAPVMVEDVLVWSGTQRGLRSRFAPRSPYAPAERVVADFNRWCVNHYLAAEQKREWEQATSSRKDSIS